VLAQERVSAWLTVSATEWVVEEKELREVPRATDREVVSASEVVVPSERVTEEEVPEEKDQELPLATPQEVPSAWEMLSVWELLSVSVVEVLVVSELPVVSASVVVVPLVSVPDHPSVNPIARDTLAITAVAVAEFRSLY
jgi:hypothetical protein